MEVYKFPGQGYSDAYLIQGAESNRQFDSQSLEQVEAMYNEGAPELVVDQGLYYPSATNYGYFCTGYESPVDWDDHHRVFGLDGQDVQYAGAQTENLPFVYYTPGYGYAQSPYNPYNPYIPGAMMGVDGPFVGAQQYYAIPSYENPSSSPAYFPMVFQSRSDIIATNTTDPFIDTTASTANRADGPGLKHNLSSASPAFSSSILAPASCQTNSFSRVSEGNQPVVASNKQSLTHGHATSNGFSRPASSHILQGGSTQEIDNVSRSKALSNRSQFKTALSRSNVLSNYGSSTHPQNTADKIQPKFPFGRVQNETKVSPDDGNWGPGFDKSKNQLTVRAYTTRAGDVDAQGNITIYIDQYNKEDFPIDYVNAKFFVIKSYSEDDVHKSIKYNVWSSTPNGNKKLNNAFEDARKNANGGPGGCPIFLFFSVNASGQFCGVAEMTGPVDFHKDMDFWQQDKWSGCFPVKWHMIKDVPNPSFSHIVLENNDNKPVTNSRDTQEIRYKKGVEVLKIFKNYTSKTSLLDDFMYYENRQKVLQEEKAMLLIKNYDNSFLVPVLDPPRKLNSMMDLRSKEGEKIGKHNDSNDSDKNAAAPVETVGVDPPIEPNQNGTTFLSNGEAKLDKVLKIGSLTITTKQTVSDPPEVCAVTIDNDVGSTDVVRVGSVPVKVNGFAKRTGILTVGSIPLDPRTLK